MVKEIIPFARVHFMLNKRVKVSGTYTPQVFASTITIDNGVHFKQCSSDLRQAEVD